MVVEVFLLRGFIRCLGIDIVLKALYSGGCWSQPLKPRVSPWDFVLSHKILAKSEAAYLFLPAIPTLALFMFFVSDKILKIYIFFELRV